MYGTWEFGRAIARRASQLSCTLCVIVLGACGSGDPGSGSATVGTDASGAQKIGSQNAGPLDGAESVPGADRSTVLANDLSGQLSTTSARLDGVLELTFSGLGSNNPQTETKWVVPGAAGGAVTTKATAGATPLIGFLDVASLQTSTIDISGTRYIAATLKVRNAPQCPAIPGPGNCAGYASQRQNVTFLAVMQPATINQTAVSRFKRFDGSDANFALTTQLLPANGLRALGLVVDPLVASMQVYRESELPAADPGVTSVFPYGFVVRNVNNNSRILPANPIAGKYDGIVTFGFKIPVQPFPTDDPFKISMRFQTVDDTNLRVTHSLEEENFVGDFAATNRALALSGVDLAVLGGRIVQTPIGNPICSVRTAGPAGAATAFLTNVVTPPPNLSAAPMNLSFVDETSEVSLGFCENMNSPTASTLFVHGSQSGMRRAGGAYGATFTGGGATNRANQLIMSIAGEKPFFPNEIVSFSATSGNSTAGAVAINPFVGSFRVKGSTVVNAGQFATSVDSAVGTTPQSVALGDIDGDGDLDVLTANQGSNNVSVQLNNGSGGLGAATNFTVGSAAQGVTLGDVNGDGKLDMVVAANGGTVVIRIGNGTGGFAPASNHTAGSAPSAVAVGDLNGDGRPDIVATNSFSNDVSVFLATGAGVFSPSTSFAVGSSPRSVALGDLNGDGKLDMVVANLSTGNVSVLLGNGTGSFGAATNFPAGGSPQGLTLGDVNGDGVLDLAVANGVSNNVAILLGNGAGSFGTAAAVTVALNPVSVVLGDVNADGFLDIVAANVNSSQIGVRLGDGRGGFAPQTAQLTGSAPVSIALGDMNGDGRLDAVTGNANANTVSVMFGK